MNALSFISPIINEIGSHVLGTDPTTLQRLGELDGKVIALEFEGTDVHLYMFPSAGGIRLQHRPGLLTEQLLQTISGHGCEVHLQSTATSESHLQQGRHQAAIRTIVVRHNGTAGQCALNQVKKAFQICGLVDIGNAVDRPLSI